MTRFAPSPATSPASSSRHAPDLVTTEVCKNKRLGRIYFDTARNAYAETAVPAYAVRALPGAPIATPLAWTELDDPASLRAVT